ncbi:unnamed protein product [Caenorhabditis bovis]|uniref:Uncharacterized protein n=1 Tax=Caenorhabditis bovis TaxID=2654633 RepID=A0A8S1EG41_9PELO|nr:unnamed protein product [Caenorhabditis bovis]
MPCIYMMQNCPDRHRLEKNTYSRKEALLASPNMESRMIVMAVDDALYSEEEIIDFCDAPNMVMRVDTNWHTIQMLFREAWMIADGNLNSGILKLTNVKRNDKAATTISEKVSFKCDDGPT